MNQKKREKYLRTRATISPWKLVGNDRHDFSVAIVIPVLAESKNVSHTLKSLAQNPTALLTQTLVVLVINQREAANSAEKLDNQKTLEWLNAQPFPQLNMCWVDAAAPGLEFAPKEGVGLARKIGFDLVLDRLNWQLDPLLISLDADTLVDENYLTAIVSHFHVTSCAGTFIAFRHQQADTAEKETAIRLYELYLRSYLFGLLWASSPYAFTAIGSALACRAQAYVAAGGMKRRQAGEDFYFLQQLVKTGGIAPLTGTVVRPAARYSDRVPFGTGRAIEAEVEEGRRLFQFISLSSFRVLRAWLSSVEVAQEKSLKCMLDKATQISPVLLAYLEESGFPQAWQQIQQQAKGPQFLSAWQNWFDGLRTRQLLTRLEDQAPLIDPQVLVAEILTAAGYPHLDGLHAQLTLLETLQGVSTR